ncbi:MFS transporter [Algoriphagus sp. PAP.12]|uniref:MFS transporter n=1 Tax=Algoriphagus sp. PAP.12 TaxID=2996678 RepID=UPI00227A964F|nr:MFS transporter [Algoriphagus sp. PAP.12]
MNSAQIQPKLGLKENWRQFFLLVMINGFVGAMVGLERSIFPKFANEIFGITTESAILSFIAIFGITKAISNYFAGKLADKIGRKNLLSLGWVLAIPIPLILGFTNSWLLVLFSNALLGISQGLSWSSTVVMKIDLVGQKERGLAMGFNEFAGYLAIGITAYLTAFVAEQFGIRPFPFLIGVGISAIGLFLSVFFVKDTYEHVKTESNLEKNENQESLFLKTTWKDKSLSSITQAGLVNNLNDGMIWGLFPVLLTNLGFGMKEIGSLVAVYPMIWGIGQLGTGKLADIFPKKGIIVLGMLVQGFSIISFPFATTKLDFINLNIVLGIGTALVYPTFLAGIASFSLPNQRAETIGIFRLWRDLGYAFGAFFSGIIADQLGIETSIITIGILTILSGLIVQARMPSENK